MRDCRRSDHCGYAPVTRRVPAGRWRYSQKRQPEPPRPSPERREPITHLATLRKPAPRPSALSRRERERTDAPLQVLSTSTRCGVAVPFEVVKPGAVDASVDRLVSIAVLSALQAIFFGSRFFWASKRKVTRRPAGRRNARCVPQGLPSVVGGTLAGTPNQEAKSKVTGSLPSQGRRYEEPRQAAVAHRVRSYRGVHRNRLRP